MISQDIIIVRWAQTNRNALAKLRQQALLLLDICIGVSGIRLVQLLMKYWLFY